MSGEKCGMRWDESYEGKANKWKKNKRVEEMSSLVWLSSAPA